VALDITAQVVHFRSLVKMKESMRGAGPDKLKARIKESNFADLLSTTEDEFDSYSNLKPASISTFSRCSIRELER
jgi:hypothetical protein